MTQRWFSPPIIGDASEAGQRELVPSKGADDDMAQTFAALGKPEAVGHAFAVTRKAIAEDYKGSLDNFMQRCPRPDYEHRIFYDDVTDNVLVVRPTSEGVYFPNWDDLSKARRLR